MATNGKALTMDPRYSDLPNGYGTTGARSAHPCGCEDAPCCGCDYDGDPRTDEEIKQAVYDEMDDGYYDDHPREGME